MPHNIRSNIGSPSQMGPLMDSLSGRTPFQRREPFSGPGLSSGREPFFGPGPYHKQWPYPQRPSPYPVPYKNCPNSNCNYGPYPHLTPWLYPWNIRKIGPGPWF